MLKKMLFLSNIIELLKKCVTLHYPKIVVYEQEKRSTARYGVASGNAPAPRHKEFFT